MVERIRARSAGPALVWTSINVPPTKSMPKFRPWKKYSAIATIDSIAEIGKLMRRKRMKSNLVSSGTMRRRRKVCLSLGSDWNGARPPHAHPISDNQPGQREGGEQAGENADAERNGEAAHRPGADIEQHRGGDKRRDIGIEDSGERAAEAGIDGIDRAAAGAHLLTDALVDQNVRINRDAHREHDAGDAGKRQRGREQRQHAED